MKQTIILKKHKKHTHNGINMHNNKVHKSTKSDIIIYKQKNNKTKKSPNRQYEKMYKNNIEFILWWPSTDCCGAYN